MQQEPDGPTCGQPGCPAGPVMRALPGPQMGRQNSPSPRKAGQEPGTRSLPRSAPAQGLGPGKRAEPSVSRGGSWERGSDTGVLAIIRAFGLGGSLLTLGSRSRDGEGIAMVLGRAGRTEI